MTSLYYITKNSSKSNNHTTNKSIVTKRELYVPFDPFIFCWTCLLDKEFELKHCTLFVGGPGWLATRLFAVLRDQNTCTFFTHLTQVWKY